MDDAGLVAHWNVGRVKSATVPESGTMNRIVVGRTPRGQFVLREYCNPDRERIEQGHGLIAFARDRGIPAVAPIPLPNGETVLAADGRLIALFPFVDGRQAHRDLMAMGEVEAMGRFLGRLHNVLREYPTARVRERDLSVDREVTLDALHRYEAKIRGLAAPEPSDGYALERIQGQRAWLERHPGLNTEGLSELRSQAIHGDYNETNLFFDGEGVCGIIDWDGTFAAPREWELMRTMHLVFAFDGPRCRTFLEAHRSEEHLNPGDLNIGAEAYGVARAHGFWLWEDIYDKGNDRLRQFLKPGGFVPVSEQWTRLKAYLRG